MLGRQELLHNNIDSPDDVIQKIEAVTPEDIQKLTEELFTEENLYLNVIGPYKKEDLSL